MHENAIGPGAPVIIELALGATIAAIPEGSEARAQFEASLLRDLSTTVSNDASICALSSWIDP